MHIAVLGNAGSWYCRDLERVVCGRGHRYSRLEFASLEAWLGATESLRDGAASLEGLDAVIVRTMPPGSLEQVVFRMDALIQLAAAGTVVLNAPKAIECAVDKYLTTARLRRAGLRVPDTVVCQSCEAACQAFHSLGGDVVVKPVFGSEGRGIVRVSNGELARRTFRTLEQIQSVLYLQKFVDHDGFDVRVLVLDGRVIGAIRRQSASDFRTNVSLHGQAQPHLPSEIEENAARQAARATGARFAGIDLLYDRQGTLYVLEVNAVPGWRAFQRVTGSDVAALVVDSLEQHGASDVSD